MVALGLPTGASTKRSSLCCGRRTQYAIERSALRVRAQSKDHGSSASAASPPIPDSAAAAPPGDVPTASTYMMSMDGGMQGYLEASMSFMSRLYYFNKKETEVISELKNSMKGCATAFTAVTATNVLLSCVQASGLGPEEAAGPATIFNGLTVGDVAYWADSFILVILLNFALGPFDAVLKSRSNQMPRLFQGVNRLGLIFQQLSIGSLAVTTVTALEAAVKYPPIVVFSSGVFFVVAMMRAVAMWWVLKNHTTDNDEVVRTLGAVRGFEGSEMPILDRWATWLAFGYLLQYEEKKRGLNGSMGSMGSIDGDENEHYEFSVSEERVLKSMTESANTAGLAIAVQALATLMLTTAEFGIHDWPGVVSNGINSTNKLLMALLMFQACQSFDRALHTVGSDDVDHLMDGLGKHGLTETFDKLSILAWAVSFATLVSVGAPWLEESAAFTALSDMMSHGTAEAVVEAVEDVAQMARGI